MDAEAKAGRAKQLLEDPLLSEVLDAIEAQAVLVWRSTSSAQQAEREVAWQSLKASERVRNTLQGIVDNGLIEARRAAQAR